MNAMKLSEIVKHLENQGHSVEVVVDAQKIIVEPCSSSNPKSGGICFYNKKRWQETKIDFKSLSAVLIASDLENPALFSIQEAAEQQEVSLLRVEHPRLAFIQILTEFFEELYEPYISEGASIDKEASIDPMAHVETGCFIGPGVTIGPRTIVSANCVISARASIGSNCFLGPGVCVGQRGFGYQRNAEGVMEHFPHLGSVRIGSNVEIGANTCIDRGTLDDTIIEDGVKIDNLCHISHNVILKRDSVVIANSMIGGSVVIGERAWVAPSTSVINGVTIDNDVTIGLGSVVVKPIISNETVIGNPAVPIQEFTEIRKTIKHWVSQEIRDKNQDGE